MREEVKHLFYETKLGRLLIAAAKRIYASYNYRIHPFIRLRLIPEKIFLRRTFKQELGYELNLENPTTYSEKIQWLKLNDRTPLHTLCADKYAVREYVKEKIGAQYLIPLVFHTDNPADIFPENLPDYPFIIKTNHNCGGGVIVRNKSKIDWELVRNKLAKSLKSNYYYRLKEWQYKNIKPLIVVEKLLLNENSNIPLDYKFSCFNGKLEFIHVDIDRFTDHTRNLYDPEWINIDCQWGFEFGENIERPSKLNQMRDLAETLSKEFLYVRVDFYFVGGRIYFGELTFHPGSGFNVFKPSKWDRIFGDKLILNINKP